MLIDGDGDRSYAVDVYHKRFSSVVVIDIVKSLQNRRRHVGNIRVYYSGLRAVVKALERLSY